MIITTGGANPGASDLPGVYVNINPPPVGPLNGAPANIMGVVGTASWGPVNVPVGFSDESGGSQAFGPMSARKFDLMTQVHAAVMQGAGNFRGIRVTDGTDTAATGAFATTGLTLTSKYTGTRGALTQATLSAGTKPNTKKMTIQLPGLPPEIFDNIVAVAAANASWLALRDAINNGIGTQGPSQIVVATAGALTTAPANAVVALSGGNDGVTTITGAVLIGSDASPRTGMYALRSSGSAVFVLADCDDSTTWSAQAAFGQSEAAYGYAVSPSGDTISNFGTTMTSVGVDSPWLKVLLGDWCWMVDGVNLLTRLVSPQGFAAGNKVAIGPHQSGLNKPLNGIAGTQKSYASAIYSTADLTLLRAARGDVITLNSPGGFYPSLAFGCNTASDHARRQDSYTTMIDYLATSLDQKAGTGQFIGRLITPDETREVASTIGSFLHGEWDDGRIGNAAGTVPYSVSIDNSRATSGLQKAIVLVQFLSVIEELLIDLTGGQTVQIISAQALAA